MNDDDFDAILNAQLDWCKRVLGKKAGEYATDEDRLHNFKVAARLEHRTPIQALGGMMAKHTVSIYDMINDESSCDLAQWDEKIGDHINYLILLKAAVVDRINEESFKVVRQPFTFVVDDPTQPETEGQPT